MELPSRQTLIRDFSGAVLGALTTLQRTLAAFPYIAMDWTSNLELRAAVSLSPFLATPGGACPRVPPAPYRQRLAVHSLRVLGIDLEGLAQIVEPAGCRPPCRVWRPGSLGPWGSWGRPPRSAWHAPWPAEGRTLAGSRALGPRRRASGRERALGSGAAVLVPYRASRGPRSRGPRSVACDHAKLGGGISFYGHHGGAGQSAILWRRLL